MSRPYSIFWMATFQILTKSLFVYESANSARMISITKFYAGVTSTCIISFIIIPISDLWNQTADSEVTFEINSHLSKRFTSTIVAVWQKQCVPDWKAPNVPRCRRTKLKICGSEYSMFNIFHTVIHIFKYNKSKSSQTIFM